MKMKYSKLQHSRLFKSLTFTWNCTAQAHFVRTTDQFVLNWWQRLFVATNKHLSNFLQFIAHTLGRHNLIGYLVNVQELQLSLIILLFVPAGNLLTEVHRHIIPTKIIVSSHLLHIRLTLTLQDTKQLATAKLSNWQEISTCKLTQSTVINCC